MYRRATRPYNARIPSGTVCFYKFMPIERLTLLFRTIGGIPASPPAVCLIKIQNKSSST